MYVYVCVCVCAFDTCIKNVQYIQETNQYFRMARGKGVRGWNRWGQGQKQDIYLHTFSYNFDFLNHLKIQIGRCDQSICKRKGGGARQASSEKPGKERRARDCRGQMEVERKSKKCQAGGQEPGEPQGQGASGTPVGTGQATRGWIKKAKQPAVVPGEVMD